MRGGIELVAATARKAARAASSRTSPQSYRIPLVNLIDGAGGSVTSINKRGHAVFPGVHGFERSVELLGKVPVVCAVLGTAAGGPAGRAILSHWSVMVEGTSQVFAAGPPVVERSLGQKITKEELGGAADRGRSSPARSTIGVDDEADCFAVIRRFLSYMPQNVWELPPAVAATDPVDRCDDELLRIVPRGPAPALQHAQADRAMIVDRDSMFEIQPTFGKALITGLARMNGKVVGIDRQQPDDLRRRDGREGRAQADAFHRAVRLLPHPAGVLRRRAGLHGRQGRRGSGDAARRHARGLCRPAGDACRCYTVVIRKCYGMAGMGTTDKNGLDFKIAWPSAEWGSLPIEGGVAAAFRREIAAAPDPKARERGDRGRAARDVASPFRTAEAFGVEDIIDPRETRPYLCRFIDAAQGKLATNLGPKAKYRRAAVRVPTMLRLRTSAQI